MTQIHVVPLEAAVFCMDCNVVTTAFDGACPVCGNRSLTHLATILNNPAIDCKGEAQCQACTVDGVGA